MAATNSSNATQDCSPRRLLARTLLFSALAGLVAAVYSATIPNEYRGTATLLLAPLPIQQTEPGGGGPSAESPAAAVSFLMAKPLSVPDYCLLLTGDEVVGRLRDAMAAFDEGSGGDTEPLSAEEIERSMEIDTRILKQTAYDIVYQPVIQLQFSAEDPALAAEAANVWADLAVELGEELSSKKKEGLVEFLGARFEEKESELAAAEQELESIDAEHDTEALDERMRTYDSFSSQLRTELTSLAADIARSEGELAELTRQLAGLPEKQTLRKALPDDAYWLMEGKSAPADSSKVLETEEANPVYANLREKEATVRSNMEGMLKEQVAKSAELARLDSETAELRKTLAVHTRKRTTVERRIKNAEIQHTQLAANYGAAQIAEAERTPDLKCISRAVPPERAAGPNRALLVLAAIGLGALIAPTCFFLAPAFRLCAAKSDAASAPQTRA